MGRRRKTKRQRRRVGKVSYYFRHGGWHIYYRDGGRQIRRRAGDTEEVAGQIAAQVNAQLSTKAPTLFAFSPLTVSELRRRFLDYHEHVVRSSLATVRRYSTATQHLENFAQAHPPRTPAHELDGDQFVRYLRQLRVAPNGHSHTARRPLRDKGIRFILETCRSLYGFAARKRHLPPYSENPFAGLGGKKFRIEDAKPVFVFNAQTELEFFRQADDWSFPIHFTLAKTGLRPGELVHLLVEDLDLEAGWLFIRNKPELGWRIKTGRERAVPLIVEVVAVLRRVIGARTTGVVFLRERFLANCCPMATANRRLLAAERDRRLAAAESTAGAPVTRSVAAQLARTVWRDAGATKADRIRQSFVRIAVRLNLPGATCPKSWRHTFATLLQDANVDPLVRQLTLGHAFTSNGIGALGMTSIYTHTRPETQRREIERALRFWPESLDRARCWAESAGAAHRFSGYGK
jgi:integrase